MKKNSYFSNDDQIIKSKIADNVSFELHIID